MDLLTLYLPVWVCWVVLCLLPDSILQTDIPLWVWVLFVLGIDVGHVWSTIFRTYLDKQEFRQHRTLLLGAPVVSFLVAMGLAWYRIEWFWRGLAYLAVFHFIKQQYGFLALYKTKAKDWAIRKFWNDKFIIYWATLYPVLYWHLAPNIQFNWFVTNDFVSLSSYWGAYANWLPYVLFVTNILYWLVLLAWLREEVQLSTRLQWGKLLWVGTTAINWYGGIVYFNSDLAFTVTNIVAHGLPYFALILYYNQQKKGIIHRKIPSIWWGAFLVIPVVFLLAFLEEYWWDRLVYGDRAAFFGQIIPYSESLLQQPLAIAIAIGILTVPQMTHYIIDGFIWKTNDKNPYLKPIFSDHE